MIALLEQQTANESVPASSGINERRLRAAVREILEAIGEDPGREGLRETPDRVARMFSELCGGLRVDPATHLGRKFTESYQDTILLRDISFSSLCEHHLLPFTGKAHVAYKPGAQVVGLSKLARVVETFARRPQVQERLTCQIADLLMKEADGQGALVIIEAEHLCMRIRGVNDPCSAMVTSAARGIFAENDHARNEVLAWLNLKR